MKNFLPQSSRAPVRYPLATIAEYGRSAGVTALALLAAWAEVPRESMISSFMWLAREGLERQPSRVWNKLGGRQRQHRGDRAVPGTSPRL